MHMGDRELVKCLKERGSPGEVTMQRRPADADRGGDLVLGRVGSAAEEVRCGAQHLFTIRLHETSLSQMRRLRFIRGLNAGGVNESFRDPHARLSLPRPPTCRTWMVTVRASRAA